MLKDISIMQSDFTAQSETMASIEKAAIKTIEDHQAFVRWAEKAKAYMSDKIKEVMSVIEDHGKQLDGNFDDLIAKSNALSAMLQGTNEPLEPEGLDKP